MKIAVVGGGNAAVTILNHFKNFPGHTIAGIADIRDDAPGMCCAREYGIQTTNDMASLIRRADVEMVIELTGKAAVQEQVTGLLRSGQHMVTAEGARLMIDLINEQTRRNAALAKRFSGRFADLTGQLADTIKTIDDSFASISRLIREGNMISINAKVQAAHIGAAGNAFEAVVNGIFNMVMQIRDSTQSIGDASTQSHAALEEMQAVEQDLLEAFIENSSGAINSTASSVRCSA